MELNKTLKLLSVYSVLLEMGEFLILVQGALNVFTINGSSQH